MSKVSFHDFFQRFATASTTPMAARSAHAWQAELAGSSDCPDRLIRIPTGFGKTLGVLAAWLWNRVERNNPRWPRRLVWCLPMRTLVEQTEDEIRKALERSDRLWSGMGEHAGKVGVHRLMGGADAGQWSLHPEHCAVLVGTQDMLLSRALNRGYAAPRARWPLEFGLLNHDCLWVMDEVQLMDVGLATSGQLQAFRGQDEADGKALRPCRSWWMSATLQAEWLAQSPETRCFAPTLPRSEIPPDQRQGPLWEGVRKPHECIALGEADAITQKIAQAHHAGGRGADGPTLVVMNTVQRAVEIHDRLSKDAALSGTDLRLVHSRFRPADRRHWRESFLNRDACAPGTDRIIVATQVVEAGVDLSAAVLVTQLAPWASLVQRFGRAARWGGKAQVIVIDPHPAEPGPEVAKQRKAREAQALPYTPEDLDAAREALALLDEVSPLALEAFEQANPQLRPRLYPYSARHLLLRHELEELFDTTPDLSGADIDISRFIRSGEERDLQVFWAEIPKDAQHPPDELAATRDALCHVPFLAARDWLCGTETSGKKSPKLREKIRAWVWDYLDGRWRVAARKDLYPGQTVLVAADSGGYNPLTGWSPQSTQAVPPVATASAPEQDSDREDGEAGSVTPNWQTIATHGAEVGRQIAAMAEAIGLADAALLDLAGRWHDVGKALPPFQNSMVDAARPQRQDLAKAPKQAWLGVRQLYPDPPGRRRQGFRHELASTLALFAVLIRHQPGHPALLGPWRGLLQQAGMVVRPPAAPPSPPNSLEQEILDLAADEFDLLAYLVCSHHGKVRMAWHASPADQHANDSQLRLRGVRDGEILPALRLVDGTGQYIELPASPLQLDAAAAGLNPVTGRGWTERVLGLLQRHGPYALAYREALLRTADQRASRLPLADPLLEEQNAGHGLEASHRSLEEACAGGKGPAALATHPAQRGAEHGLRGRAGEPGDFGSTARPPAHATRYLETTHGRLSYAELAPLLAARVLEVEQDIEHGRFDDRVLDDGLILDLQRRLCDELVPAFLEWRRIDVMVGTHTAPEHFRVPMLMREYSRDLAARLEHAATDDALQLEALAFAEGRLLSIHPFADFNGRITRLLLRLMLRQLDLPGLDLLPSPAATDTYLAALAAGDRCDWRPLMAIWVQRLQQGAAP